MSMPMLFDVRAAPPFMKNGFVLGCEQTHEGVIIDPGDEVDDLLDIVQARQLSIKYILLTHAHIDHIIGVDPARDVLKAPVGLHRDDLELYSRAVEQGQMFGFRVDQPAPVDFFYRDGDGGGESLRFGQYEIRVHHTPGHSPGGV